MMATPAPDQLDSLVADLSCWQRDGLPAQLHPGDLGWQWRFGSTALAAALRVWTADGTMVAVGLADATVVRLAVAPSADHDTALARAVVSDLERLGGTRGSVTVEARFGTALRARLRSRGWADGEPWTPLVRDLGDLNGLDHLGDIGDLSASVHRTGLRVEAVGPDHVEERVEVQRAAFERSSFTTALWQRMSQTSAYRQARCLVGYDGQDTAVAAVTVWSAGSGRPGLLEPMGVHRDHRGHGYGTAITAAAAAALRDLGASSALVATPSANAGGIATYLAAGFRRDPDVTDFAPVRG